MKVKSENKREALSKCLLCETSLGSVDSSTEEHGDDDCGEDQEDEADGVGEQEEVPRSPLVAGPGPVFTSRVSQRTLLDTVGEEEAETADTEEPESPDMEQGRRLAAVLFSSNTETSKLHNSFC